MGWHFICAACAKDEAIKSIGFIGCPAACECCGQPLSEAAAASSNGLSPSTPNPVQEGQLEAHRARCQRRNYACRCMCPGCYVNSSPGHCRDTARGCLADARREPRRSNGLG